jgi:carboxyl-terminal processing protease
MPRRTLQFLLVAAVISLVCYARADRQPYGHYLTEILDIIDNHYLEPVDEERMFESAVSGMTGQLDENSSLVTREDLAELEESIDQHYAGIGIEITLDPETKELTVLNPLVGAPAYQAGVRAGDKIVAVDGKSTTGFSLQDAEKHIRGEPGKPVRLRVQRLGVEAPLEFVISRATNISTDSVRGDVRRPDGSWDFRLVGHPEIGYLRINNFGERTVEELSAALVALHAAQVKAIILDLRDNPGGLLPAAVGVCERFIPSGKVIVTTRGRDGETNEEFVASDSSGPIKLPLCVLVNGNSASASEIVAACLQDYGRAKIIGERSYGKGTIQQMHRVAGGKSVLKLTTSSYWRPSGKNIHRRKTSKDSDEWGVRPDTGFELALSDDELAPWRELRRKRDILPTAAGEQRPQFLQVKPDEAGKFDPQLEKAVQFLESQIKP